MENWMEAFPSAVILTFTLAAFIFVPYFAPRYLRRWKNKQRFKASASIGERRRKYEMLRGSSNITHEDNLHIKTVLRLGLKVGVRDERI